MDAANNSIYPNLDVADSGDVFVTWSEMNTWGTDADVYLRVLDSEHDVWGSPIPISQGSAIAYRSTVSIDGYDRAHLAWGDAKDYQGSGTDYDIFTRTYGSMPQSIGIDVGGEKFYQFPMNADWYMGSEEILSDKVTISGQWVVDELNEYVSDTQSVEVPIAIQSYYPGAIELSNIHITYTLNPDAPTNLTVLDNVDSHVVEHLPTLSWKFNDQDTTTQGAYQLQVGKLPDASDMWDSGEVTSDVAEAVYGGLELLDGQTYYWCVRTRDADGSLWGHWANSSFTMNTPPRGMTFFSLSRSTTTGVGAQ